MSALTTRTPLLWLFATSETVRREVRWTDPLVQVIGDDHFRMMEPWSYDWIHGKVLNRITVAQGFEFDGASIPTLARPIIGGPWALGLGPPALHDWFYAWEGRLPEMSHTVLTFNGWVDALEPVGGGDRLVWSREDADRMFGRQMREWGVPRWKRRAAYRAVRLAVWKNW